MFLKLINYSTEFLLSDSHIKIICNDSKVQEQLTNELRNDTELSALLILQASIKHADLAEIIKERASVRWAEKYSDSLFLAVYFLLCYVV